MYRDVTPEQDRQHELLRTRGQLVEAAAFDAEAVLYEEFEYAWGAQARADSQPLNGAGTLIDRAFLESNLDLEAQTSQLAADRAIDAAQRNVAEAYDELSA